MPKHMPPDVGKYADTDWQKENSDVIHCPDCEGPVLFKDWEDDEGRFVATHYRCDACRINWWSE